MSADRPRHPWRANIEAVTLALILATLFKYFLVEAYRIPSESMQPTLMGWSDRAGGGVFDRISRPRRATARRPRTPRSSRAPRSRAEHC
ncbi:MAG: S26 family signal peptidase [bacterium]|nr:S26 family signal peptidase [bacterium]